MALDPLTAGLDAAKAVIERIWPDKTEQEKAELAASVTLVQGQLDVNKAEAANSSIFVAGWRPFIGWVCGAAFAWNWIGLPIAKVASQFAGTIIQLGTADMSEMMPVLLGMLGLGAMRSYDKVKGTSK